jgi:hypothetical protein
MSMSDLDYLSAELAQRLEALLLNPETAMLLREQCINPAGPRTTQDFLQWWDTAED